MLTPHDLDRAPCLAEGPLAAAGTRLVEAARSLGTASSGQAVRAWTVAQVFALQEASFASDADPVPAITAGLEALAEAHASIAASGLHHLGDREPDELDAPDVAVDTGQHYGNLFAGFSPTSYFDEPAKLLRDRLERNGITVPAGASVLDAGCGGGRYTVAWTRVGAAEATGVDISEIGIADARRRADEAGTTGVRFEQGSVLDLPYEEGSFDVVFSNGVLHHTTDWEQGVDELVRVLRPGGLGWLYLIEAPGGLFWDLIEILRVVTEHDSKAFARRALLALGIPANRVFYMLDHVMVPINLRLTAESITERLAAAGAVQIERLARGTDFDRVEAIHRGDPYAAVKFGVGEHRFTFSR